LDPQPLDLAAFLGDTVDLVRSQAEAKGLALRLEPLGVLPRQVRIDAGRLRQVMLNLVSNAIKFTAGGAVTITAAYQPDGGGRLLVKVRDTGAGIPPEHRDRLFQRFSQVDESNTRRYGGAGLGLAISKGLVELMGGEIGLESAVGVGSTFWFTLDAPAVEGDETCQALNEADSRVGGLRILVVDDVAGTRELVTALLSSYELDLSQAASGAEAVEAAKRDSFDLILMDLQMPGMDGLAATRAIRNNSPLNAGTPILALSANVMGAQVAACMAAGMNDHIAKPINPAELYRKIDRWTAAAESASA